MDHDEKLAELLDRLLAQQQRGEEPLIDQAAAQHPELAIELRQLWAAVAMAENFACPTVVPTLASENVDSVPIALGLADYELQDELGRGGMGVVYRARQKSLNRIVALKMILRRDLASQADVARFRAEAESAARLEHPHIVKVFEVGEHNEQPFFSMQFIDGSTLASRLANGPLPAKVAAELLLPVCRAIADAHRCGVLHRDLKPSNILIDENGHPYVTDFGLAKRLTSSGDESSSGVASLTQSGAILGTPSYMAPEQAAGQRGEIGIATDVYALGAILYAMLTGRPPFQAASPVDTVLMVLEQEPVPARVVNPKADADLEVIALKCLQKPQDLRYATADALADDLDSFLRHEPISARSSQFTQVLSRAFRETHHASVLENWGLLWMLHSCVVLVLCLATNWMQWQDAALDREPSRWPYLGLWVVGMSIWAAIFYGLRRRAGPVTFIERQIVHVWASSMIASMSLFVVEGVLGMSVLALSPIIGLISGMVFLVKASMLTGKFYVQAAALFVTGILMAVIQQADVPDFSIAFYGFVSAGSFFVPGLKYYRQRVRR